MRPWEKSVEEFLGHVPRRSVRTGRKASFSAEAREVARRVYCRCGHHRDVHGPLGCSGVRCVCREFATRVAA